MAITTMTTHGNKRINKIFHKKWYIHDWNLGWFITAKNDSRSYYITPRFKSI